MNVHDKIRVSEFGKRYNIDRKMLYYFIGKKKIDVVNEYGLKLIVMNERANNFIKHYKD